VILFGEENMPQIIFKGIKKEDVKLISKGLVDELQQIIGCPRDYFTLEVPATIYLAEGKEIAGNPLIQVNWFERGQKVQDCAAAAITRYIRQAGYSQTDIFFVPLAENNYYENGTHF
jgi:hypothetical protein